MRNRLFLIAFFAFLLPIFASGQNVKIVGKTNRPNTMVRLLAYDDMLTMWETQLSETQSDKDGKFVVETTINEITPVNVAVGLERVDFIICPNGNYDIEIQVADHDNDVSYFDQTQPALYFNSIDDGGFYTQHLAVMEFVDSFIYDNINKIVTRRNLSLLDTLDNQINRNFGEIKFKYTNDYVKYRKASATMTVNTKKTLSQYFDNQEVLYSQPAYMEVFLELFKTDIADADFLSRNPQLAELISLNNIRKRFFSNACDKQTALKAIEDIRKSSKYQKNQLVATHIANLINDLTYDSDAPSFSLKDKKGNTVQLADYQNDMVLLQFVDRVSPLLEHEFSTLNELQKQWNDTIQVVTIATKESFDDYVQLFDKQGYKWTLLNLGDKILLLENYHVKMCPAYIILKRRGRVGMAPAPSPDHNLDIQVRRICRYL